MGKIILILIGVEIANFLLGLGLGGTIEICKKDWVEFENNHLSWVLPLGLIYWILKLTTYPLLIPYRRNKKKRENIKKYHNELIRKIDNHDYKFDYKSMSKIQNKIEELKKSLNQDLYSRASDSYNDMLHILIKCSDGIGNIDIDEFESIIKEALNECTEIVNVAYKEHEDRLNKAKQQYYNNKKEEIKQDLENMKNKNKEFKTMWRD